MREKLKKQVENLSITEMKMIFENVEKTLFEQKITKENGGN